MRDVSHLMNKYRECSRNIWNIYFAPALDWMFATAEDWENWELAENIFGQLKLLLFEWLVQSRLDEWEDAVKKEPPILRIIPKGVSMSVLIRRPSEDGNFYWDQEPNLKVGEDEISLAFVDFYDFGGELARDYLYYLCNIKRYPLHPEYEGREALVKVVDSRVIYDR